MSPTPDWHDPFADDEEALRARAPSRGARGAPARRQRSRWARRSRQSGARRRRPRAAASRRPPSRRRRRPQPPPDGRAAAAAGSHRRAAAAARRPIRRRSMRNRRILARGRLSGDRRCCSSSARSRSIGELNEKDPPPPKAKPVKTTSITIPEGLDRHQIADEAKKAGLRGNYLEATKKAPKGFDLAEYGAKDAPNLEGFLFPDTWDDLPKNGTVNDLVQRQLEDFKGRIAGVDLSYAKSKNLTVYDVLKIASMIEREVQVPEERKLVSEVIYNRLKAEQPARDRRDDPLRGPELRRAADREQAQHRHALQHPHAPGPAADADRQSRAGRDRGRGEPGQGRPLLLRGQAGDVRRARVHLEQGGVRPRPGRLPAGARGPGRLADRLLSVPRLAVLGHPVGHSRSPAMHTAALAELGIGDEWSYEAIEVEPEWLRGARPLASRRGLRGRQRHRPAQARGPGPGRLRVGGGAGDRRREHAQLRRRHRSPPRTPTRSGSPRAIGEPVDGKRALVLGAGRLGPRGGLGPAQRGRRRLHLEPNRCEGRVPGRGIRSRRAEQSSVEPGRLRPAAQRHNPRPGPGKRAPARHPRT